MAQASRFVLTHDEGDNGKGKEGGAMTASEALREFAKRLDAHKPSAVQREIGSPLYNAGCIAALEWASAEANKLASELAPKN